MPPQPVDAQILVGVYNLSAGFSDSFSYSAGDLVAVSGGNWTYATGGNFQVGMVAAHTVSGNAGAVHPNLAYWSGAGGPAPANQSTAMTFTAVAPSPQQLGPAVRVSGTSGYFADIYASGYRIVKVVSGTETYLTSFTGSPTAGDVFNLTASGTASTVLTLYRNGSPVATDTDSASPITTGTWGIWAYASGVAAASNVTGTSP
jgi:hypothetical protein